MKRSTWSMRKPLLIAFVTVTLLIGGVGVWSVQTEIAGAVVGKGRVKVASDVTAVQHPIGGVVSEILVRNGDHVEAGDVMVRLDASSDMANLEAIEDELFETLANLARFEAIVESKSEMTLHPVLAEAAQSRERVQRLVSRQAYQLAAHYDALNIAKRLLREQISQVEDQISGVEAELSAQERTLQIVGEELAQRETLASKNLVKHTELFKSRREQTGIEGKIGQLTARVAELRGKASELELKLYTLEPLRQELAAAELSKLRPARTKFLAQLTKARADIARLEIRAPVTGYVHDTTIMGVQSVVTAAKPLMEIIPSNSPVLVQVDVDATEIDQIYQGQSASLRFPAFNRRSTPLIFGEISVISPDAFNDPRTKKVYYEVVIFLQTEELERLDGQRIVPGMPVEAFISTEARTPLAYVTRPLMQYFDRALRDT